MIEIAVGQRYPGFQSLERGRVGFDIFLEKAACAVDVSFAKGGNRFTPGDVGVLCRGRGGVPGNVELVDCTLGEVVAEENYAALQTSVGKWRVDFGGESQCGGERDYSEFSFHYRE